MTHACANCEWARTRQDTSLLECRAVPPSPQVVKDTTPAPYAVAWPLVDANHWCRAWGLKTDTFNHTV